MKYCQRCLYPANHPLTITFDEHGVCSGCRVHEEKDALDWKEREEKLKRIVKEYRTKTRPIHDCIVPVSGARDSYFIVHVVKNRLKLHPLLVSYNKQYNTRMGIRNLAYLRTLLGLDIVTQTVSPNTVRKITRETLRLRGSMYWHCLAGTTVFPVQMAVRLKIPLIIWGAHQGCDQVGMFSHLDEVEMTRKYRKEHDLMGLEAEDLARQSNEVTLSEMEPYVYPHEKDLAAVGVRGIYLSNYYRWDSKAQHEQMIADYGYESVSQQRTFDTYNDVDCFHYSGLHDYIKYVKWGYGKATDHASREIRLRRMTREQGIDWVARYQDVRPKDTALFSQWLGISEYQLWEYVDAYRDPNIWEKYNGSWKLKDSVLNHKKDAGVDEARLPLKEKSCDFHITHSKEPDVTDDRYVLIGRGYVDIASAEKSLSFTSKEYS